MQHKSETESLRNQRTELKTTINKKGEKKSLEVKKKLGERIYIFMTHLCCCMAETNTKLKGNFPPVKKQMKF